MSYQLTTSAAVDGEYTHLFTPDPTIVRTGKVGVLLCHGANVPDNFEGVTWPAADELAAVLTRFGIPCLAQYMGGNLYGNATSQSRLTDGLAYLAAQTGCSASKAHVIGLSMGAGAAVNYAGTTPAKVASVTAMIPMSSIINLAKTNPGTPIVGGFAAAIATAWGTAYSTFTVTLTNGSAAVVATAGTFTSGETGYAVIKNTAVLQSLDTTIPPGTTFTYVDATHGTLSAPFTGTTGSYTIGLAQQLPPTADLVGVAGPAIKTADIPGNLFYSTVDQYIQTSDVTALAAASGLTATAIDSVSGHANGTIAEVAAWNGGSSFSQLLAFLVANGA